MSDREGRVIYMSNTSTPTRVPTYDIMVCQDCYFAHHYGYHEHEGSFYAGDTDTAADREPLSRVGEGMRLWDAVDTDTGEGMETFSWSWCEGCGSQLGGSRYSLSVETI